MTEKKSTPVLRPASAAVLIAILVCVTAAYVLVPDPVLRDRILLGCALVGPVAMGFLRRILGSALALVLVAAIAIPQTGCTPAQKEAFERAALSALEMAAKMAGRVLLNEAERALKFETSGGEEP